MEAVMSTAEEPTTAQAKKRKLQCEARTKRSRFKVQCRNKCKGDAKHCARHLPKHA